MKLFSTLVFVANVYFAITGYQTQGMHGVVIFNTVAALLGFVGLFKEEK